MRRAGYINNKNRFNSKPQSLASSPSLWISYSKSLLWVGIIIGKVGYFKCTFTFFLTHACVRSTVCGSSFFGCCEHRRLEPRTASQSANVLVPCRSSRVLFPKRMRVRLRWLAPHLHSQYFIVRISMYFHFEIQWCSMLPKPSFHSS